MRIAAATAARERVTPTTLNRHLPAEASRAELGQGLTVTWTQIVEIVNSPAGIALLALAILWTGSKGVWVYGKVHDSAIAREQRRADEWKDIAMGTLPVAEKAVDLAERRR